MRKTILAFLITVLVTVSVSAQLPEQIKEGLKNLTVKVDKLTDASTIQKEILSFISAAPNEDLKKKALVFIQENSKSAHTKEVLARLLKGSDSVVTNKNYIVLKNANIIDAISDTSKKGSVFIEGDKITAIDYTNSMQIPEVAAIYDLEGKYIIPGLIDAHVHITHGTLKDAQEHLQTALKKGVTGVRDMGGDGRMLTLLKKNTMIGEDVGPDVFFSTIIAGPEFFENDPRPKEVAKGATAGKVPWQTAITHDSDLRQVVAEAKGLGATAIKVYLNVDKDLFRKVAAEAKRQRLKVWSHAVVPPTKAIDITNGGSEVMSHAASMVQYEFIKGDLKSRHAFKSQEELKAYRQKSQNLNWDKNSAEVKRLFNAMKANNSILDATMFVYTLGLEPSENGKKVDSTRYKIGVKAVKIAYDMGVKIGAGSDHMISKDNIINIHREIELLTLAGLSNIDAIKAATIINAEGLGEEKNIGTIEKGKLANLVVLNTNPLENIESTKDIKFVIKRGKIVE
ncbi:amidohydrolase family protein [Leptobacterium flavescens]|uniref:Amidohydrolase family protein n=1 Tax=Leptobacterium flavescens TaxID=472055 RepID=A0A6P0UKI8_9FLAO|nr:amidohydrolase family protein [Leptobacterium flavescens]NER13477.1 amidohydrolase family protein [Leptobacterium flavescens]